MRKTGKIIKCIICNKDFYCKRVHLPTRKFCSSKCYWLDKKETSKGENNPFYGKKHSVANNEINRKAHLGKSAWNKGLKGFNKGSKNVNWKGGKTMSGGYIYILKPNHPFVAKNHYVPEHRLVAEKELGRYLTKTEIIHHINEIKTDNRSENLYLFSNRASHLSYHQLLKYQPDLIEIITVSNL